MDKVQYINKAKVLKIVGEDSEQAAAINKLMVFTLPARDGYWEPHASPDGHFQWYRCSVCGYDNIVTPYFCERCGARMNGKDEKNEKL